MDDLKPFERFFKPGFLAWLAANEHIYKSFEEQAFRLIGAGREHYSARTIIEVLVHHSIIAEKPEGLFKIGNDRAPDLARVFAIRHPHHARFWEYRRPDWPMFLEAVERKLAQPA
jgi:hypothetical protein